MRNTAFFLAFLLAMMLAGILAGSGCNSDNGGVEPVPEACSLTVIAPEAGSSFNSQDQANIRWEKQGEADTVGIELLQGGAEVGTIVSATENDGFFPWNANVMGGVGGDFTVKVSAVDRRDCTAESGVFTVNNTAACNLVLTNTIQPDTTLRAGHTLPITWESHDTLGLIGIELWHGHLNAVRVGVIANNTPDDGLFDWEVDSFNDAAHRTVSDPSLYWLRIFDESVAGCEDHSLDFTLIDNYICEIDDFIPGLSGGALTAGETVTIGINVHDPIPGEFIKIRLYAGNIPVPGGQITPTGMDIPATELSYPWQVQDYGYTAGGIYFNVRVIRSDDEYCWGRTNNFAIKY